MDGRIAARAEIGLQRFPKTFQNEIATLAERHQESTRAILKALEGKIVAAEERLGGSCGN